MLSGLSKLGVAALQKYPERGAYVFLAFHCYGAAMALHQAVDEEQADAGAFACLGVETAEKMKQLVAIAVQVHAQTVVFNFQHGAAVGHVAAHANAESPLRGAMLGSTPHKLLHLANRPVLCVPVAR